jgi:hypothetical protein
MPAVIEFQNSQFAMSDKEQQIVPVPAKNDDDWMPILCMGITFNNMPVLASNLNKPNIMVIFPNQSRLNIYRSDCLPLRWYVVLGTTTLKNFLLIFQV